MSGGEQWSPSTPLSPGQYSAVLDGSDVTGSHIVVTFHFTVLAFPAAKVTLGARVLSVLRSSPVAITPTLSLPPACPGVTKSLEKPLYLWTANPPLPLDVVADRPILQIPPYALPVAQDVVATLTVKWNGVSISACQTIRVIPQQLVALLSAGATEEAQILVLCRKLACPSCCSCCAQVRTPSFRRTRGFLSTRRTHTILMRHPKPVSTKQPSFATP